ncbi:ribosome-inactivating family protein [Streptomyces sp. NPDC005900]|uniref:ribosome-inactivating family protein n=1 Tax=Streptomyces sp. NPDC005900 TaxID=3154569 RepID=UPI0034034F6C
MQPITAVHRIGKRLGVLCLALLTMCGVMNLNATPARADFSALWTEVEWDITDLHEGPSQEAALSFRRMVNRLRTLSGHNVSAYSPEGLTETMSRPSGTGRYIELRILDRTGNDPQYGHYGLTFYFRVDNLYLDGFTARGRNYYFPEQGNTLPAALHRQYGSGNSNTLMEAVPYSSNYNALDSQRSRGSINYSPYLTALGISQIRHYAPNTADNYRRAFASIIQLTSESVRNGWISDRIATILEDGETSDGEVSLGEFGMVVENEWSDLSRLAYRSLSGNVRPSDEVEIEGERYRSIEDMRRPSGRRPALWPFMALSSRKNS